MKITIGITVYNRLNYIRKMCLSLKNSVDLEKCSIRIYDDCSAEFDAEILKKEFPFITEYKRRENNLGSDNNMRQMYFDFLESGDDVLVNCDSDMIFRKDWIARIFELLPLTDGVLSLYNSSSHIPIEHFKIGSENILRKESIGAAGSTFRREIVRSIVANVTPSFKYDWDWSRFLDSRRIRLLTTENSYIQHIGVIGENCDSNDIVDYGLNFFPLDEDTLKLNVEFFQQLLMAKQAAVEQKNRYYYFKFKTKKYKILQCVIEPLSLYRRSFLKSKFFKLKK